MSRKATMDCTGCAVCVESCPDDALYMADFNAAAPQEVQNWEYALQASVKTNPSDKFTVKGSQFETPLLEFSGACAGCGTRGGTRSHAIPLAVTRHSCLGPLRVVSKLRTIRRHGFRRDLARFRTQNFAAAKIFRNGTVSE